MMKYTPRVRRLMAPISKANAPPAAIAAGQATQADVTSDCIRMPTA